MDRDGTIALWDTSGLEAGEYTLRLTVESNLGDPIQISNFARLGSSGDGASRIPTTSWTSYR